MGKIDLLLEVNRRMQTGKSINAIQDQHMILLDTNRLFAIHKSKQELEQTLLRIFIEATKAGNVIIVIENLSSFISEAKAAGILSLSYSTLFIHFILARGCYRHAWCLSHPP